MKYLTLIRHAKSSWDDPELTDFERPLKKRGKKDAPKMGKVVSGRLEKPELFLCSPAKRALKTAHLLCEKLGLVKEELVTDPRLYHAGITDLNAVLSEFENRYIKIFLCAHNPGITEFVNYLTLSGIEKIPTCGVAHIMLPIENWKDISFGIGKLVFFDYPKRHR
jgi:phosphohistidine phosphatase